MKQLSKIILLAVVGGAVYGAYWVGDQRGFHRALRLQAGTFVGTLDALDKIRGGDIDGGTKRIESVCFSAANTVYGDFVSQHDFPGQFVGNVMKDDLIHYRHTYRTNSAEWTPASRTLSAISHNGTRDNI